ncbi:hypothetical protein F4677DRAFT_428111 [Hypoxylon crocopeplum]|nr:hypothetical protein F4677DRAFT_428111 [Hypoxylon crocopeplum]
MHNSTCPKCGSSFSGEVKTCDACGAVSLTLLLLSPSRPSPYSVSVFLLLYLMSIHPPSLSRHDIFTSVPSPIPSPIPSLLLPSLP